MIIPTNWILPDAISSRVSKTTFGRQRAIAEEGQCLLVLRDVPRPDEDRRPGVLFWFDENGQWRSNSPNPDPSALRRHVSKYAEAQNKLEDETESAQDLAQLFDILERLNPLKRSATNMFNALQQARENIGDNPDIIEARDLAYDVSRDFELLLEEVKQSIELRKAKDQEQEAEFSYNALVASHRLNTLAAFTFPLMAISGLLGVNIPSGLEESPVLLFWFVLITSLLSGFALKTWVNAKVKRGEDGAKE